MRFSIPGDFNPRSPDGERPCSVPARSHSTLFQSTLPGWGATYSSVPAVSGTVFQSTLPGWGATGVRHEQQRGDGISIHAPRMGSDLLFAGFHCCSLISIHAPRMGSDAQRILDAGLAMEFQSTLPGWGATQFAPSCAPLPAIFQSTLPGWGATGFHRCYESKRAISIHAPRMGSDGVAACPLASSDYFNPRSPDGERHGTCAPPSYFVENFNPRSPDGERRQTPSPHTPRQYFNPRSPDGERPLVSLVFIVW